MNHKGPRGANGTITTLAGFQKQYAELYKSMRGIVSITETDVHLMDYVFVDLFHEEEVVKSKEDDNKYPYRYRADKFGTKFICMSRQPLEFKKYPIEELAHELMKDWNKVNFLEYYFIGYKEGAYRVFPLGMKGKKDIETIYTWEQLQSEESIDLEQAILDYEEVLQNESNV